MTLQRSGEPSPVAAGAERPRAPARVPGTVLSAVKGLAWPALPPARVMAVLAVHEQLHDSERWRPERLAAMQFRQLGVLLDHAKRSVPHYRRVLPASGRVGAEMLRSLPILTRAQVQADPAALLSDTIPPAHLPLRPVRSSGSTGRPVELKTTSISEIFRSALLLREQRWHQRDLTLTAATIRNFRDGSGLPPEGKHAAGWVHGYVTKPVPALNIRATVDEQLEWLQRVQPAYLSTFPTNMRALAQAALERGMRLPQLRQISTYSESLPAGLRELVQQAFAVTLTDIYSSEEAGPIAFQCPRHEDRYHVQSENLIVEVVDVAGQPCSHGTAGRVLITDLHNLATPLIRYAIDDYAETGPACDCGRGLPVLTRILGRTRNMLRMPGGQTRWPTLPSGDELGRIAPVRQFQLVQKDLQQLELALVAARPLSAAEEARVRAAFLADLGGGFTLTVSYATEIARTAGGKYEDFRCDMPAH
jgi:phenylacetate-CoA ligase